MTRSAGEESPAPYAHWMLREIHEQPGALAATLAQYVDERGFREESCAGVREWLARAQEEIVIAASGSSRHAGMVAEVLIEEASGMAVDVEYASEFAYRTERFYGTGRAMNNAAVLVISQSGETADTLAALRKANRAGQATLAITNVADSTMAREAAVSFPAAAGRERAIPATKSFTAQLLCVSLLTLLAAEAAGTMQAQEIAERLAELRALPEQVKAQMAGWEEGARRVARRYRNDTNFLFLGRGVHYPIAREGALKLKESAYLHAEGYPSGELKHGPNALVGDGTPLVMLATVNRADAASAARYEKVLQLMTEMREQDADILAIANAGDAAVEQMATNVISVEPASETVMAITETIPLQMLAYFMALQNGIDVDRPRNLTKAVLAE